MTMRGAPGLWKKDISEDGGWIRGCPGRKLGHQKESELEETLPSARQICAGEISLAGEANWKRMIVGWLLRFIKVICCR